MAGLRFTDVQSRPTEFLDFTSLTLDEFQQLVPPFETAFHAWMAAWRMDGKPRTARRFTVYKNCPLATPFAPMPASRFLHASRFDQTPARFTAVGDAAGVHEPHLVKIVPLRVRGLKTFWTIAP
jgi:hypothetical protein